MTSWTGTPGKILLMALARTMIMSSTTASDYLSRATEAFRSAQVAEATRRIMEYGAHAN